MPVPLTIPFQDISAADLPVVGGKGANLGEMSRAGFPVPPGFCLTTTAFRQFIASSGIDDRLYESLESLEADDVEGVRRVGAEMRAQLKAVTIPAEVESALLAAWQAHGEEDPYAVRSSATAEDLPTASFAGQQDTFLNVIGQKALLSAVKDCWISLFTDRAILYRAQNGFDHRQVSLSVVIQRMIYPEISGILFTADPASGHRGILAIDASYGLGEALVAGLVSADLYRVDKRSLEIIETRVGDKQLAIRTHQDGGTYRENLPEDIRSTQVLDEDQIKELAVLGRDVEKHYGSPQDIEWVLSEGKFSLVQTRPITSLFPLPEPLPPDDNLRVYFSISHAQVMTDVISPMGLSILRLALPFGTSSEDTGYRKDVCHAGGRFYADLSPLLYHPILRKIVPSALSVADELGSLALSDLMQRQEFLDAANRAHDKSRLHTIGRNLAPLAIRALAHVWFRSPEKAVDRALGFNRLSLGSIETKLFDTEPGLQRLQTLQKVLSDLFMQHAAPMAPYIAAAMVSKTLLERLVHDDGDPDDIQAVLRGLHGNVTTEMDLQVGDLADVARRHPAVADLLSNLPSMEALGKMGDVDGGGEFLQAYQEFLHRYGMRGPSEIDIARVRWQEDPTPLLQVIVGNLSAKGSGAHRRHHADLAALGEAAVENLAASARHGIMGPLRAAVVRRMGRVARGMFAVREHPKYLIVRAIWYAKQIILQSASQLVQEGRLENEQDVWLLQLHELIDAFKHTERPLGDLIEKRRAEQSHFRGLTPPRLITSDGEIVVAKPSYENLPEGALGGSPVSGGVVEGIARVVLDPSSQVLHPGEILVAPFTDPGWTPLFINAAGLVMEVGGLMTHGSVVAREYGLPAVVGVPEATQLIETGQRIRVDGDQGFVEIVSDGRP